MVMPLLLLLISLGLWAIPARSSHMLPHSTADLWQVPQHTHTQRETLVNRKQQSYLFTCYLLTDRALRPACNLIEFYFCFFWATPLHLFSWCFVFGPRLCLSHLGNFNIILSGSSFFSCFLLCLFFFCFLFSCVLIQSKLCILHNYNI